VNDQRLLIAACQGVYRMADTARYFNCPRTTVQRIWLQDLDADHIDPPDIWGCRPTDEVLVADTSLLLSRGKSMAEVAECFGVSEQTIRRAHARLDRILPLAFRSPTPLHPIAHAPTTSSSVA
jgi:hypothetical protein